MYALKTNGVISGYTRWPNNQTSEKVDEKSKEWLDYLKPSKAEQIAELEAMQTKRYDRAAILGDEYAIKMLKSIEVKINLLRKS